MKLSVWIVMKQSNKKALLSNKYKKVLLVI